MNHGAGNAIYILRSPTALSQARGFLSS